MPIKYRNTLRYKALNKEVLIELLKKKPTRKIIEMCIRDSNCIGGGVSENQIFIDGIKTAVKRFYQSLPIPFPQPEIVKCKYCNDANIVGAYLHYLRKNDER